MNRIHTPLHTFQEYQFNYCIFSENIQLTLRIFQGKSKLATGYFSKKIKNFPLEIFQGKTHSHTTAYYPRNIKLTTTYPQKNSPLHIPRKIKLTTMYFPWNIKNFPLDIYSPRKIKNLPLNIFL